MSKSRCASALMLTVAILASAVTVARAHDPRLTEITGLPQNAIYSVQQRVLTEDAGQYELLYYSNRVSAAALAAAPNRICRYVGGHLASSQEVPTAAILQKNLPEVRKVVVRCD